MEPAEEVGEKLPIAQLDFSTEDGKELCGTRLWAEGNLSRRTVRKGDVTASDCVWLVLGDKLGSGRRSGWEGKTWVQL